MISTASSRTTRTDEVANHETKDKDKQSDRHADNDRHTASHQPCTPNVYNVFVYK